MNIKMGKTLTAILLAASTNVFATAYYTPPANQALIGQIQHTYVSLGDNATTIAERYDLGYNALESANPQVDLSKNMSYGENIQLPTRHLLPEQARKGIVVN